MEVSQSLAARSSVTIVTVANVQQQSKVGPFVVSPTKKRVKNAVAATETSRRAPELPLIRNAFGSRTDDSSSTNASSTTQSYSMHASSTIKTIVSRAKTRVKKHKK